MSEEPQAGAATPHAQLLAELLDPNVAKSEREWAAARMIEDLSAAGKAVIRARKDFGLWASGEAPRAVLAMAGIMSEADLRKRTQEAFAALEDAIAKATGQ